MSTLRTTVFTFGLALGMVLPVRPSSGSDLGRAVDMVMKINSAWAQSQDKIDKLTDTTANLAAEYRSVEQQIASIETYNEQVATLVAAQNEQVSELDDRIKKATSIGRELTPMMLRMVASLEKFVQLDVPFLQSERAGRVKKLKEMMNRPEVTVAEKYRRILEAYQIENEYGRTIEAYQAKIPIDGKERTVDLLRVGRIAFVYQTLDGSESAVWDQKNQKWTALGPEYTGSLKRGFKIARKQAPPDLFRLPIPAATVAEAQ